MEGVQEEKQNAKRAFP